MKIAIIGAGPSGIALSFFLKDSKSDIWLFEKNSRIGEKLRLTGGGRMNLTNSNFGVEYFVSENKRTLSHMFKSEFFSDVPSLVDELGIKHKWENDRVISASESAEREVDIFENRLRSQKNIKLMTGKEVLAIKKNGEGFDIEYGDSGYCSYDGQGGYDERFDVVVLATGGMVRMGESVDSSVIYKLANSLGHTITDIKPALHPISIKDNPFRSLSGVSIKASLKTDDGKHNHNGEILFTHSGISGPAVLNFSLIIESGQKFYLDFLPEYKQDEFSSTIKQKRTGKIRLRAFLKDFLPLSVCDFHMQLVRASKESNVADLTREQERKLLNNLFRFEIIFAGKSGYGSCWTTRGGIPLDEINISTMESKKVPGLYFAGEILDVSGECGGYNISFALVSAKLVSEAILRKSSF